MGDKSFTLIRLAGWDKHKDGHRCNNILQWGAIVINYTSGKVRWVTCLSIDVTVTFVIFANIWISFMPLVKIVK